MQGHLQCEPEVGLATGMSQPWLCSQSCKCGGAFQQSGGFRGQAESAVQRGQGLPALAELCVKPRVWELKVWSQPELLVPG